MINWLISIIEVQLEQELELEFEERQSYELEREWSNSLTSRIFYIQEIDENI